MAKVPNVTKSIIKMHCVPASSDINPIPENRKQTDRRCAWDVSALTVPGGTASVLAELLQPFGSPQGVGRGACYKAGSISGNI